MDTYQNHKSQVGMASIGKTNASDPNNNIFLWTHLYMPEEEARVMTEEVAIKMMENESKNWRSEVREIFEMYKAHSQSVLSFSPVYNGKIPAYWYSKRMILIGDAAHPYGPGGNGISMALKDAEDLCGLFLDGELTDEKMVAFQKNRTAEAQKHGEGAEERNKPENQITSRWRIVLSGLFMKGYHLFNHGVLQSFE